MNNKDNYKSRIGRAIALILIMIAATVGVWLNADTFIIYYGIAAYRLIFAAVRVALGASVLLGGVNTMRALNAHRNYEQLTAQEQSRIEADRRERESFLSASKRLNEGTIRDELSAAISDGWKAAEQQIGILISQSNKMDEYQEKLAELLRKNGAERLDDAEDILDRVEQGMLKNIRKVLNYIEISDPKDPVDADKVVTSATECIAQNKDLLENTSGFLFSLTDYLNSQGEDDRDEIASLDNYRQILIKSTK